ncbi:hypothetical protein [Nocardia sp. BMG51109]|uniref:hypothetical protein n=1 Tax=Nocardia sp. BMG51109 TaxID=1056816 RepID=UPI00046614EB|nr:hypothetical protein [Nocardia sp. BMG51109]
MARFGHWRRSVTFWRVSALVLVALPQVLDARFPESEDAEAVHGDVAMFGVAYLSPPPLPEQWLEYVAESGLAVLLPAVALVLPHRYARTGILWAAGVLAALGVAGGYLGLSALQNGTGGSGFLLFMSLFYLPAASALALSERANRPAPSEPEMS